MRDCWRAAIPAMWKERNVEVPPGKTIEELVAVPENAPIYPRAVQLCAVAAVEIDHDVTAGLLAHLAVLPG